MAKVELDYQAFGDQVLRGPEMARVIAQVARQVAGNVSGVPTSVRTYTTDRCAASVALATPRGMLLQARDGVLTRAAAAAGLQVRAR